MGSIGQRKEIPFSEPTELINCSRRRKRLEWQLDLYRKRWLSPLNRHATESLSYPAKSRTSLNRPVTAAAAAIAGLTKCVRLPGPCRPTKLRLLVEAQRSPAGTLSGFMPRHIEHPGRRHMAGPGRFPQLFEPGDYILVTRGCFGACVQMNPVL